MKIKVFYFLTLMSLSFGFSQKGKITNHIYDGNKKAETEAYVEAEKSYRKALSLAPEKAEALYNLGNTHFLDKQYEEASQRFFQTQKFAASKEEKHQAFHNMGNVYMQKKEYQKAVEAYKNALRNNPADEETRYNYALAKELLENEKPPEEQEQDDNKDQQDQEDQKDQDSLPPYDKLDDILECLIDYEMSISEIVTRGHEKSLVKKIENLLYISEYKRRQSAPGVKVSQKNFGRDRRYPITNLFRDKN